MIQENVVQFGEPDPDSPEQNMTTKKTKKKTEPKSLVATDPTDPTALLPGEVPVLRTCRAGGISYNDFKWPLEVGAVVEAPDWSTQKTCGMGLHGLLRGEGDGSLLCWEKDAVWMVVAVDESKIVAIEQDKVKFPSCRILLIGSQKEATDLMVRLAPGKVIVGAYVDAGDRGTATAGYRGTATAGDRGTATAGYRGTATAGYGGTATAGDSGTLVVKFYDEKTNRYRLVVGYVGEDGILPNVPYVVRGGKLTKP